MRADLPSLPGKWAATATRPSSVTFGDSFPPMGEAKGKDRDEIAFFAKFVLCSNNEYLWCYV